MESNDTKTLYYTFINTLLITNTSFSLNRRKEFYKTVTKKSYGYDEIGKTLGCLLES